jgi:hypothetical protein
MVALFETELVDPDMPHFVQRHFPVKELEPFLMDVFYLVQPIPRYSATERIVPNLSRSSTVKAKDRTKR